MPKKIDPLMPPVPTEEDMNAKIAANRKRQKNKILEQERKAKKEHDEAIERKKAIDAAHDAVFKGK